MTPTATDETKKPEEPAKNEATPQALIYDRRIYKVNDIPTPFEFLVIDKPEKWETAKEITSVFDLPLPGGKTIKIPLRSLSWGEWEDIETEFPPYTAEAELDSGSNLVSIERQKLIQRERDIVTTKRRVKVFEVSTGKPVPGETIHDKCEWLGKLGTGNADALFNHIMDHCSGLYDEPPSSLMSFKRASREETQDEVPTFSDFTDLVSAANMNIFFRSQRPTQTCILEFPVKHVSDALKKEIEDQTPDPIPPSKPGKNPVTGKPDASYPIYSYTDSRYLLSCRNVMRLRTSLWMEALLSFTIPGETSSERYEWLRARPLGDIFLLKQFIQNEILSYQGRVDFF